MGKVINIQPVTRIEGHAKVSIFLDDAGNVSDTRFYVQTLRGFEKFCEGRPAEEMPRIVCHICGICPWAHHLASSKATDALFGVTPPPAAVKLRRLMQSIAYVSDKILHFFFLAAPDFVIGPDADYCGAQCHRHRQGRAGHRQAGGALSAPGGQAAGGLRGSGHSPHLLLARRGEQAHDRDRTPGDAPRGQRTPGVLQVHHQVCQGKRLPEVPGGHRKNRRHQGGLSGHGHRRRRSGLL